MKKSEVIGYDKDGSLVIKHTVTRTVRRKTKRKATNVRYTEADHRAANLRLASMLEIAYENARAVGGDILIDRRGVSVVPYKKSNSDFFQL